MEDKLIHFKGGSSIQELPRFKQPLYPNMNKVLKFVWWWRNKEYTLLNFWNLDKRSFRVLLWKYWLLKRKQLEIFYQFPRHYICLNHDRKIHKKPTGLEKHLRDQKKGCHIFARLILNIHATNKIYNMKLSDEFKCLWGMKIYPSNEAISSKALPRIIEIQLKNLWPWRFWEIRINRHEIIATMPTYGQHFEGI